MQVILANLAPSYGYDPTNVAVYNNKFRNVVFSHYSAERLYILYTSKGLDGVKQELNKLKDEGVI